MLWTNIQCKDHATSQRVQCFNIFLLHRFTQSIRFCEPKCVMESIAKIVQTFCQNDMVLISHNIEELKYLVDLVADEFKKFGLKINMAKTKFMKVSASSALYDPVILRNIEQVRVSTSGLHAFRLWENRLRNRITSIKSILRLQVSLQTGMVPTKNKKQHQNKVVQRYGASSSVIWLWILGAFEPSHSAVTEVRNTMFANNLQHFSLTKIENYRNKKNSKHQKSWNNDSTKKIEVARTRRKNVRNPSTQNITGEQNSWW